MPRRGACPEKISCSAAVESAILPRVQIIRAEPILAPALSAIAWAAKAHWGYSARSMEQWREQLTITPDFIAANETFAAEVDGRFIGFHALLQTSETWRLEHLWILPEQIGRGFGRRLFTHAAARAVERGAGCLTIEADPHAEPFYRHMGAVPIGSVIGGIDGGTRELPLLRFDLTKSGRP